MTRTGLDQLRFTPKGWEGPHFLHTRLRAEENQGSFSKKGGVWEWLWVWTLYGNWHFLLCPRPRVELSSHSVHPKSTRLHRRSSAET